MSDYFIDLSQIKSLSLADLNLSYDSISGILEINGNLTKSVDVLHVNTTKATYHIPVFKSKKLVYEFSYKARKQGVQSVKLRGSMNGWNAEVNPLTVSEDGLTFRTKLILNPGVYSYHIVEDGEEITDPNNPNRTDNGMGGMNSIFTVGNPEQVVPHIVSQTQEGNVVQIVGTQGQMSVIAFWNNQLAAEKTSKDGVFNVEIPASATTLERSYLRIYSSGADVAGNDLLLPLEYGRVIESTEKLQRTDLHSNVMYFAMVDRFVDGDSTNNNPTLDSSIHPKANHFGGDLAGISRMAEEGYFNKLGINSLWISPILQNPDSAFGLWNKGVTSSFSSYHGYWPVSSSKVDYRFGTSDDLKQMIDILHNNNINLLIDYVANHVHEEHPLYKQHPEWATSLYLPDGTLNTEKWDEHRLTTWFDVFLPTLDFSKPEVVEAMSDSASLLLETYNFDGFRHDATKHIQEEFWRALTAKIKKRVIKDQGRNVFQIGETYGNPELISSYISSGQMDSQFDFNLYDAAVDAFAKDNTGFTNLKRVLEESISYYGSNHLMGNITGNQDRARFISYADGSVKFEEDAKLAGWTRTIENQGEEGYSELKMLMAFLMASPGIPCIYYGDEIGMPGANDPDNRRMMHFDDWNTEQQKMFDITQELITLRRSNLALMYGTTRVLNADEEVLVIIREYMGEGVIIWFDKNASTSLNVALPSEYAECTVEKLSGMEMQRAGNTVEVESKSGFGFLRLKKD